MTKSTYCVTSSSHELTNYGKITFKTKKTQREYLLYKHTVINVNK